MGRDFDDVKRFEAFKQKAVEENEQAYGREVRERYGDDVVDAANAQFMGLTGAQLEEAEALQARIGELLAAISAAKVPEEEILGDAGRELCGLHRDWLLHFWTRAMYSPAAHRGLAQMYVADERFATYYEAMAPDGAAILRDAVETWAERL